MATNKKRILCLIDSLGAGGAQRQMVGLASLLKEEGYDTTVAFYHPDYFYVESLKKNDVAYIYLEKAKRSITRIWYIAQYIRKYKPDVVIAYLFTPCICACLAKLANRKFNLIVSERNTTQVTGRNERIRFWLFQQSNYVVPNSYAQEEYIKKEFPRLADKLVTIPNFVDLDYFTPPIDKQRREIPEIMIAASIWASKNTLGFIDAVAVLKDKGFRFHISWYGLNTKWLDYIKQCKEKIEDLQVAELIELKEKTEKIRECYQNADYFCLPSFYEGTPNVICEAMSCGLPVACSDVCDNSRYVKNEFNGFLFNPKDCTTIANSLGKLLSLSDEEYSSFCLHSRELAEKYLSKDKFVNAYINVIENENR